MSKKVKVLTSEYLCESGFTILRVYSEKDFEQAEKDLKLLLNLNCDKEFKLTEAELY